MTVSAQPDHKSGDSQSRKAMGESRKAMGVWKMTEELELTENQAEKFIPKFRTHQDAVDKLREEQRKSLKSIHESLKESVNVNFSGKPKNKLDNIIFDQEEIKKFTTKNS